MPKVLKWVAIILAICVVVLVVAITVAPMVISFDKLKPQLQAEASKALNRPVTLGGEISPSVFPWVGIAVSGVHIGNPPGFKEKDFVSVGSFELRVKLFPLLTSFFKQIEIKRFVIKDTKIVIEKNKEGKNNLEGLGKGAAAPAKQPAEQSKPPAAQTPAAETGLPIKSFEAKEFAITNAQLLVIDEAAGSRHEIKDFNLVLTDFSLDKPIGVNFSALADGKAVALTGKVGPVGPEIGKSPVAVDLVAELLKQLKVEIKGRADHPMETPAMDITIQIPPFSPRKVLTAIDQALPFEPADPKALGSMALTMKITGTPDRVAISDGLLTLDESKLKFQAQAAEFDKPDLQLKAEMDQMDVDRYLPPPAEKKEGTTPAATPAPETEQKMKQKGKTDYTPLRKLILDAQVKVGALKAMNVRTQNIILKATAKNGVIRLDPMSLDLYKGKIASTGTFNVQQDQPRSSFNLGVNGVQAGPLLKDFLNKELIEGAAAADVNLNFSGDQADMIRKTLDGKGEIKFIDGAVVGLDLANMVRNVQTAFGLTEKTAERPRTDFTDFVAPFTISKGVANLNSAQLNSPLLRVAAGGTADLVQETLDMRIEPKFVATLAGQGDNQQRAGLMVPVIVSGTFAKPKFKPDLKSILTQQLPDQEALKKMVPDKESIEKMIPPKETIQKDLEQKAQDLLKGLPFGKPKE